MRAWKATDVPALPGGVRGPAVRVHDSASRSLVETKPTDGTARLYVCGITPYDATHLGHAATYVAFDLLNRAWRSAGYRVHYVQNVTDVDDPLFERADRDGVDWRDLAAREVALFRDDMAALRVQPPREYVAATEAVAEVVELAPRVEAVDEEDRHGDQGRGGRQGERHGEGQSLVHGLLGAGVVLGVH